MVFLTGCCCNVCSPCYEYSEQNTVIGPPLVPGPSWTFVGRWVDFGSVGTGTLEASNSHDIVHCTLTNGSVSGSSFIRTASINWDFGDPSPPYLLGTMGIRQEDDNFRVVIARDFPVPFPLVPSDFDSCNYDGAIWECTGNSWQMIDAVGSHTFFNDGDTVQFSDMRMALFPRTSPATLLSCSWPDSFFQSIANDFSTSKDMTLTLSDYDLSFNGTHTLTYAGNSGNFYVWDLASSAVGISITIRLLMDDDGNLIRPEIWHNFDDSPSQVTILHYYYYDHVLGRFIERGANIGVAQGRNSIPHGGSVSNVAFL